MRIITTGPFFNPFFSPFFGHRFPFHNRGFFFFGSRFGPFCASHPFRCRQAFGIFPSPFFSGGFFSGGFFPGGFWPSWGGGYGYAPYGMDYTGTEQLQAELADQRRVNQQLEDQLKEERLRRMQADVEAAPPAPPASPSTARAPQPERPTPATVLVYRNGSRTEVQNYAIVGNTLYELALQPARKIALADLDLPATVRENEERGVQFHLPSTKKPAHP